MAKSSSSAKRDVDSSTNRLREGAVKSGKGTVQSRKQSIYIGVEARQKGKKAPKCRKKSS
jgi:hypothetical protein